MSKSWFKKKKKSEINLIYKRKFTKLIFFFNLLNLR